MNTQDQNTVEDTNFEEVETSNNSTQTSLPNVTVKADVQKIEKTGDNMNSLDTNLQKQPDKVSIKQAVLEARLNKLTEVNKNIVGRWMMNKGDKELLQIDSKATQEALEIIRKGENSNLSAIADYQTRYLKTILHNLTLVGESNIVGAAKLHYENAKMVLHEKLLIKMDEMITTLENFEKKASTHSQKGKAVLLAATDRILVQWGRDFDTNLNEFAELLKKTFSK